MISMIFFVALAQNPIPSSPSTPSIAAGTARVELETAVKLLEQQIKELSDRNGRTASLKEKQFADFNKRVADLSEQMFNNSLLTRAYLALAVSEMELLQAQRCGFGTTSSCESLRDHAEAIEIAIDARVLDDADRRVYQSLRSTLRTIAATELAEIRKRADFNATSNSFQVVACERPKRQRGVLRSALSFRCAGR